MVRPGGVRLAPMIVIYITIELLSVQGRKCVCTSKACLAAGVDTCRTRFACYTEMILTDEGRDSTTTRGCTENGTPLVCENRPRSGLLDSRRMINGNNVNDKNSTSRSARVRWPYLRCCNSEDYCNSGKVLDPWENPRHKPTSILPQNWDPTVSPATSESPESDSEESLSDPTDPRNRDKKILENSSAFIGDGNNAGQNSLTLSNVKPLHVATLVLAVAALISVLAACYVVTRFLKSHNHHHHLYPESLNENN